jgi:hypothetical protein
MKNISWSNITPKQLIELRQISPELDPIDRAVEVISIAYKIPYDVVDGMDVKEVIALFSKCQFLNTLPNTKPSQYIVGKDWNNKRRKYRVLYDLREIKAHHYIELQHILADSESIEKLPEVMALITKEQVGFPLKIRDKKIAKEYVASEYEDRVKFFSNYASIQDCHPVMLFFSLLWKESYDAIQSSLISKIKEITTEIKAEAQQ